MSAPVLADTYEASDSLLADDSGSFFSSIVSAVSSVGNTVAHAAESVGGGVVHAVGGAAKDIGGAVYALSPVSLVKAVNNIAHGARVDRALLGTIKDQVAAVKTLAPYVQTVVSLVPGVGTGAAAAIAAGAALAQGKSITDSVLAGVRGAVPGGRIGQAAFDTATRAIVTGQRIDHAALDSIRNQLPAAGRPAFDIGVAVASGKSLQHAVKTAAQQGLQDFGGSMASRALTALDPIAQLASSSAKAAFSHLRPSVAAVANALSRTPSLRGVTLAELARRFHVHEPVAREAMSAVVGAVSKMASSGGKIPALRVEPEIVKRLASHMTLDHALAQFASHAAAPVHSPSPTTKAGHAAAAKSRAAAARRRARPSKRIASVKWKKLSDRLVANIVRKVPNAKRLPKQKLSLAQNPGPMKVARRATARGLDAGAYENEPLIARGPNANKQATIDAQRALVSINAGPKAAALASSLQHDPTGWGHFGPITEAAVKEFQASRGLPVDGVIGTQQTWPALDQAMAPADVIVSAPPPQAAPPPAYRPPPPPTPVPVVVKAPTPIYAPPKPVVLDETPAASPHVLQAQLLLAGWGKSTGKISPADYGQLTDLSGTEDERFHAALRSYQLWAKGQGQSISTDGDLDDGTYQSLVGYATAQVAGATMPNPVSPATPAAPPRTTGTSSSSGGRTGTSSSSGGGRTSSSSGGGRRGAPGAPAPGEGTPGEGETTPGEGTPGGGDSEKHDNGGVAIAAGLAALSALALF